MKRKYSTEDNTKNHGDKIDHDKKVYTQGNHIWFNDCIRYHTVMGKMVVFVSDSRQ